MHEKGWGTWTSSTSDQHWQRSFVDEDPDGDSCECEMEHSDSMDDGKDSVSD